MAKTARKSAKKAAGDTTAKKAGRKYRKSRRYSWSVYVHRALKQVNKNLTLSSKTMKIVNSFVNDIFERVAVQASGLVRATTKRTLGSSEIQTAVRLVLPAELAKHAMAEGTKAVGKVSA